MQSPVRLPYSVLIWTAIAALAVGLFAGMSLLALNSGWFHLTPGTATPTQEPSGASTPGISSSDLGKTPVPPAAETSDAPADSTALIGLWLSAASAISALIGLVSSLWLGWRKEGREAAQHQLELEKARLEIRKLQQELAESSGVKPGRSEDAR